MTVKTFIERPVLSIVISVAILLLGLISLMGLPIEQFPNIAPPTVEVTTSYPGANAQTVEKSVIVPLEEAINGVEDMTYISSTSSNAGDAYLTVYFKQGTDPDMAAVNVQNRVSTAAGLLPAEVTKIGVTTNKQQKSMLKAITLYSPDDSYDTQFLNNYLAINVIPRLKRISGVGAVTLLGSNYSMRIWLKPDVMGHYGLIPADVTAALAAQNIESATGSFGENYEGVFQYTMKYKGRLSTPEEFGDIVIKSLLSGEVLRLKEIADVELGDEAYNYRSQTNGHPGALFMVYQTAGSNATEVINAIDREIERMSKALPKGVEFGDVFSTKDFLDASMHQVIKTLFEAFFLVVLIVFIFLQDVKSVIIPAISIVVSLVGTFIVMSLIGFSINLLTLFALVLAIGIVVDDAIIVVEARFDIGYKSPFMATNDAMKSITSAIVTTADAVLETLAGYYSGAYVSNFNRFSKLYRVMIQASPDYRVDVESLDRIMTRTPSGMAPLSNFVTITKDYGPESVSRFNLYSSMGINGESAPGYSSGDAIRAVRETAGQVLPKGYTYEFSGISREESETSNNTVLIFMFCFVFVYLILCGLYESFLIPFSVLLSVPFGLMGSFLFAKMMGLENNIYLQTGLIMLIGLLAKTAILVTGYAVDRRKAGMSLIQPAVGAAKARFRPILMTVLAMIFGLLPLMFSSGAGANGNSSLGSGVVGGLLVGALALLFFVPAMFIVFQSLQERIRPVQFGGEKFPDLQIEAEKEDIKIQKKKKGE